MARENVLIEDNLRLFRIDIRNSFSLGYVRWMLFLIFLLLGVAGTWTSLNPAMAAEVDAVAEAGAVADKVKIPSVVYENATRQGPPLVVLPGQFKMTNQNFSQKISPNNIADFAEIELEKANFQVLERAHLGPLLEEVTLAVNMGDPEGLRKFRRGKFISTRWFIQFDVLKAEPVAQAGTSFDGKALGDLVSTLAGDKLGGRAAGGLISSVGGSEEAQIWLVGMKYKIIDAASSAIVSHRYIEEKMEVGGSSTSFLGFRQTEQGGVTLDSMVHWLVQKCVAEIDKTKGMSAALSSGVSFRKPDLEKETGRGESGRIAEGQDAAIGVKGGQSANSNLSCQELRKSWQLGDSSVMQQYLKECAK